MIYVFFFTLMLLLYKVLAWNIDEVSRGDSYFTCIVSATSYRERYVTFTIADEGDHAWGPKRPMKFLFCQKQTQTSGQIGRLLGLWKCKNGIPLQRAPDLQSRGSAPGPCWGLCPYISIIGFCSVLTIYPPNSGYGTASPRGLILLWKMTVNRMTEAKHDS